MPTGHIRGHSASDFSRSFPCCSSCFSCLFCVGYSGVDGAAHDGGIGTAACHPLLRSGTVAHTLNRDRLRRQDRTLSMKQITSQSRHQMGLKLLNHPYREHPELPNLTGRLKSQKR